MAKDNGNGTVTVQKGDTLSGIAQKFLGSASKYQELAKINGISNPNFITVGQIIKLSGTAGGSTSSSSTRNTNMVEIKHFGVLANGSDNTLYVAWTWNTNKEPNTASYTVEWSYDHGDGIWFYNVASVSVNENARHASRQATFSIPAGAKKVRVRIKPISKEVQTNSTSTTTSTKKTYHWIAAWSGYKTWTDSTPLVTPSNPTAKIEKYKLTAEVTGLEKIDGTHIVFEIYKKNGNQPFNTSPKVAITTTKTASYSCNVDAGAEYMVRCKSVKGNSNSEWTGFVSAGSTSPATPASISTIKATSETSVYLEWDTSETAKTYDIEYSTEKNYFDNTDQTTTKTGIQFNRYELIGLESGQEYFFRVRAVNDGGESPWSDIYSVVIGKKPSAPTTWSSTTNAVSGEELTLFWVHNAVDGSSQNYAELELTINGVKVEPTITIKNTDNKDEKDKTSKCFIDTANGVVSWMEDYSELLWAKVIHTELGYEVDRKVIYGIPVQDVYTSTYEKVSLGFNLSDNSPVYYCISNESTDNGASIYNWHQVLHNNGVFTKTDVIIDPSTIKIALTETGEKILLGKISLDEVFLYTMTSENKVTLAYKFIEGVKIQWRVRTAGITNEYGEWSVERTVNIYAPPTVDLRVLGVQSSTDENGDIIYNPGDPISTLTSFPFYVYALPGPRTQTPIGYHVSVKANESYESVDQIGNEQIINKDSEIYSKYFDITDTLLVEFTPGNIDLQNGMSYTVTCTVTMNSGLTSEASQVFDVLWTDELYSPNATIAYDSELYVTHIQPYCEKYTDSWRKVTKDESEYVMSEDIIDETQLYDVYTTTDEAVLVGKNANGDLVYYCIIYMDSNGNSIDPLYYRVSVTDDVYTKTSTRIKNTAITNLLTVTGEEVSIGRIGEGESFLYAIVTEASLVDDVLLSVYRREFDGGFTEIITGLDNTKQTSVTDPHPSLDYARYRIVATTKSTGAVSYYDMPGFPINEVGAIVQWNEVWTTFDADPDSELAQPPWTGSLLRIPYNIDISENNSPDVSLIKYIGRKRPVAYYGTHLGEKSTWNMVIPKSDKETVYALRRLQGWMGDVYVREPSGIGHWANITVSFNTNHGNVTIPVTINVTRVEGGM